MDVCKDAFSNKAQIPRCINTGEIIKPDNFFYALNMRPYITLLAFNFSHNKPL